MSKNDMALNLFCEYLRDPLGIQNERPRFSWTVGTDGEDLPGSQISYRILVSLPEEAVPGAHTADCWDSGTVLSDRSTGIRYAGVPLRSRTRYHWTAEIRCEGSARALKGAGTFETGIFSNAEWEGRWIGHPQPRYGVSPLFRKEFDLPDRVLEARAYVSGIGYYNLYINGQKVGDRVLEPGWTDYRKRILYSVYDVTGDLREGRNAVGAELGEGWYGHRHESFVKYTGGDLLWHSEPKLLFEIRVRLADGEWRQIVSDGSVLCAEGPIVENGVYNGETYDASREQPGWNDAGFRAEGAVWRPATPAAEPPAGILTAQIMPPIRITEEIRPVSVTQISGSAICVDFGQNFAGWAKVVCAGPHGGSIVMRYGEMLRDDGTVGQENLREANATDRYILSGSGRETYAPRFTYHGFRYLQIECAGSAEVLEITGQAVHTDVRRIGRFHSGDEILDRIHKTLIWTERSNMHSLPTDCPQRDERQAWLNDMTVRCSEALYNFDLILFYEKWLDDITDAQNEVTGSIPDTAPHVYGGNPSFHISSCLILIPWLLYLHYSDPSAIEKHYGAMKRYLLFLVSQMQDGLIGEPYYGEWAPPAAECMEGRDWNATPKNIPPSIITTGYVCLDCDIMEKAAQLAGRSEDAAGYRAIRRTAADALNRAFFHEDTGGYGTNSQGSNIFPLFLRIVDEAKREGVLNNLLHDLLEVHGGHVTTGNQMTKYLFDVLQMEDRNDIALEIARSRTYPSLGYMVENGATTLWERWEKLTEWGMNSHNHPMDGACTFWFFSGLAGIRFTADGAPLKTVLLEPAHDLDLDHAGAEVDSVKGTIRCEWKKTEDGTLFKLQVPWNMRGTFRIRKPRGKFILSAGGTVLYDGHFRADNPFGIALADDNERSLLLDLPAGSWSIRLRQG